MRSNVSTESHHDHRNAGSLACIKWPPSEARVAVSQPPCQCLVRGTGVRSGMCRTGSGTADQGNRPFADPFGDEISRNTTSDELSCCYCRDPVAEHTVEPAQTPGRREERHRQFSNPSECAMPASIAKSCWMRNCAVSCITRDKIASPCRKKRRTGFPASSFRLRQSDCSAAFASSRMLWVATPLLLRRSEQTQGCPAQAYQKCVVFIEPSG